MRTFASIQVGVTNRGQGIQVGTAADCKSGQPVYYAWHSFHGHRLVIDQSVAAGDRMRIAIGYRHLHRGFNITDVTQGWAVGSESGGPTNPPMYRAAFLVTARSDGDRALPLTDFSRATFLHSRVNGQVINLQGVSYVTMETPAGVPKAFPLPLRPHGRFAVLWQHH
jgi:hypothetical protein